MPMKWFTVAKVKVKSFVEVMLKHMFNTVGSPQQTDSGGSDAGGGGSGNAVTRGRSLREAHHPPPPTIKMNGSVVNRASMHHHNHSHNHSNHSHNHSNHSHNHSGLSHNHSNVSHHHHPHLNLSALSASKHSVHSGSAGMGETSSSGASPGVANMTKTTVHSNMDQSHDQQMSPIKPVSPAQRLSTPKRKFIQGFLFPKNYGVKEMLSSLGLLCVISLLSALLSLTFLLRIQPVRSKDVKSMIEDEQDKMVTTDEYLTVYEVTLGLGALTLALDLSCLLVCAVQFIFALKLLKSPRGEERTGKYLKESSSSRVFAIGGYFLSIPVFLTGVVLYMFIQFHSTSAIVTSVLIGLGIVFCGFAMVHNVYVWQKEKTAILRTPPLSPNHDRGTAVIIGSNNPQGLPSPTLDLSGNNMHELSTLV